MKSLMNHMNVISKMYQNKLDYNLIKEFPIVRIEECCNYIEENKFQEYDCQEYIIQNELVKNPNFLKYLEKFYHEKCDIEKLKELIEVINANNDNILDFKLEDILFVLQNNKTGSKANYTYLKYFMKEDKNYQDIICENLSYYYTYKDNETILNCSNPEIQDLFKLPFLSNQNLLPRYSLEEAYQLLCSNHELKELIAFLYNENLCLELQLEDYNSISPFAKEIYNKIKILNNILINDDIYRLLCRWIHNGCNIYDLSALCNKLNTNGIKNIEEIVTDNSSYINFIYGNKLHNIPFTELESHQEKLIVYAIKNHKKSFLNVIENNRDIFLQIPRYSILYSSEIYLKHCNINELRVNELKELNEMISYNNKLYILNKQVYTFEEIKTLYNLPTQYLKLYNYLLELKVDKRLLIIKQLAKKDLLDNIYEEEGIKKLADKLKMNPLYKWMEINFANIQGISASDTLKLLMEYEKIEKFIPEIRNQNELAYIIRNYEIIENYHNLDEIKANIENIDIYWNNLKQEMNFTDEFIQAYKDNIKEYLLNNGSEYTYLYYKNIYNKHKEPFKLIVKSVLMGEFKKLKYHKNDLSREIEFPLSEEQIQKWITNYSINDNQYEIKEYDDFYHTMILGEKPQRTCLSYNNGMYNQCLLACFDSNKKILYARKNGRIVARAMLRLTKGMYYKKDKSLAFVDVEKNEVNTNNTSPKEYLTLFLEKMYLSGISEAEAMHIEELFIKLVEQKSKEMNALLVLSKSYINNYIRHNENYINTIFYMFISKSKASSQYLDSLNGQATISDEGEYKSASFLIYKSQNEKNELSNVA